MYVHSSYRYLTLVLERELSSSTYQHTYSTYLALVPKVDDLGLSHNIHLPIYLLAYLPTFGYLPSIELLHHQLNNSHRNLLS